MRKTKGEKGITLIALIITIVVLLILAAVAIESIQNDGIIKYAQNAADSWNRAGKNEADMLQEYVNHLKNSTGSTTYKAYTVGQTVTIKNGEDSETFYVIEDSDETQETVLLLTKECINTEDFVQSSSSAEPVEFSSTNYWADKFTTSGYDLVETGVPDSTHYAMYAAYMYAKELDENATGRLMEYDEALALLDNENFLSKLCETPSFWLGSASDASGVFYFWVGPETPEGYENGVHGATIDTPNIYCRPVVKISKTLVS